MSDDAPATTPSPADPLPAALDPLGAPSAAAPPTAGALPACAAAAGTAAAGAAAAAGGGFLLPTVAAAAVLAVSAGLYLGVFRGGHGALEVAAKAPRDSVAALALGDPRALLEEALKSGAEASQRDPKLKELWEAGVERLKQALGFDGTDLGAYAAAGFDLSKPLTLAVLTLDERGAPKGVVVGIGITEAEKALTTVRQLAERHRLVLEEAAGDPPIQLLKAGGRAAAGAVVRDGRLLVHLAFSPRTDVAESLRTFLKESQADPLSDTEAFKRTVGHLRGGGVFSGYLNLSALVGGLKARERLALLDDLVALAFAGGKDSGSAFLALAKGSRLIELLRPGAECRDLLRRLDKPLGALTLSLADAGGLLRYLAERTLGDRERDRLLKGLERDLGQPFDDLAALVKGGSGGVCLYARTDRREGAEPAFLAFAKINDRDQGRRLAGEMLWGLMSGPRSAKPRATEHSGGVVYTDEQRRRATALVGDYVVAGTAVLQIERLAKGEGEGWSPACGGSEPLAAEMFMSESMAALFPRDAKDMPALDKLAGADSYAVLRVAEVNDDGVLVTSEGSGSTTGPALVAMLSAVMVPNLVAARQAGNEAAAVGALKTIANAQALYREMDKDGNGVLDYGTLEQLGATKPSGLVDALLASGQRQGYAFEARPSARAPQDRWMATARPLVPGTTGDRYFMTNHSGVIWYRIGRRFDMDLDRCEPPADAVPFGR